MVDLQPPVPRAISPVQKCEKRLVRSFLRRRIGALLKRSTANGQGAFFADRSNALWPQDEAIPTKHLGNRIARR
jgi:hypothetical protein